jgi:rare lipoprotein A
MLVAILVLLVAVGVTAEPSRSPSARRAFSQVGLASYYHARFAGQKTASGVRFDPQAMVAAHRALPLGTVVRVTNLKNQRAVPVRIVDRGPYGANRRKGTIIDLSPAAARRLGFGDAGLVRVRIRVIRWGPTSPSP